MHTDRSHREERPPLISLLTPTRNRSLFLRMLCRFITWQRYPRNCMEWIIADDSDPTFFVENEKILIANQSDLPSVHHYRSAKSTIGKKRQQLLELAHGDIMVHIDDDDYYPPSRVDHVVKAMRFSGKILAGLTTMYAYFTQTGRIARYGPLGAGHSAGNSLAYTRAYANDHHFEDRQTNESMGFCEGFSASMIQLHPRRTILHICHGNNTVCKNANDHMIKNAQGLKLDDFVFDQHAYRFYQTIEKNFR